MRNRIKTRVYSFGWLGWMPRVIPTYTICAIKQSESILQRFQQTVHRLPGIVVEEPVEVSGHRVRLRVRTGTGCHPAEQREKTARMGLHVSAPVDHGIHDAVTCDVFGCVVRSRRMNPFLVDFLFLPVRCRVQFVSPVSYWRLCDSP